MQVASISGRSSGSLLPVLYTATIFVSASLLFFVQPMFAKLVLPNLGGSSAVWTTAMLFFQTVLILGYLYAHLSVRYLPPRLQVGLHVLVWAAALSFLPIALPEGWAYDPARPAALQTLGLFALGVGAPFAALSATAPLLQSWYGRSGGPSADDPYFLYGASNLGSLLSLLAFPFLAEPFLGVQAIGRGWAGLYILLGAGLALCGLAMLRGGQDRPAAELGTVAPAGRPGVGQIAHWLALAFLPSSLMLSVTSIIATDIGSFPLVWVIPLSLYLLSFVFAFSRAGWADSMTVAKITLVFFIYSLFLIAGDLTDKMGWLPFAALVIFFFLVALVSHRRLYQARPDGRHLTAYYVTMSVGGALGGLFNSILAPAFFDDVHEGPLMMVAAALLVGRGRLRLADLGPGLLAGLACALPVAIGLWAGLALRPFAVVACLFFFAAFWWLRQRPLAVAAAAALLLVAGELALVPQALWKERSFFGAYRVVEDGPARVLMHGTTNHGSELIADIGARPQPTTYYGPHGPLGRTMAAVASLPGARVGVVGLGIGALACYRKPGQDWHFYEIDAAVDRIARNPALFDFMPRCAPDVATHIGDARLVLTHQDLQFDLLVIDAYSSDAIPVHLLTSDAMRVYLDRLAQDGVIAFHISNRFFDLQPVLARIARDLALSGRVELYQPPPEALEPGEMPSYVVVLSRSAERIAAMTKGAAGWQPLTADAAPAWSDDHSNLLGALR